MKKGILVIIWMIFAFEFLIANNYYVSPSGNNVNPGTFTQPFKTISFAIDSANAGDTVYVRGGEYREFIYFNKSGNLSSGYIVLKNFLNEKPIIDGQGVTGGQGLTLSGVSYIIIDGFEIRNCSGQVITIDNLANNLKFNNLDIHDFEYGVSCQGSGCHHIEFNYVECHHFAGNFDTYGFDVSYDTAFNNPHHDFVFNYCKVHSDMNPTQNVDGFATGHWNQTSILYNFTYNHCIVYDVFDGWDVSAKNTTINACLGYNCYNGVWKLWSDEINLINCIGYIDPSPMHPNCGSIAELDPGWPEGNYKKTVTIQNCTFYGGEQGIHVYLSGLDTLILRNSIVVNSEYCSLFFEDTNVLMPSYRGDYNILASVDSGRLVHVGNNEYTFLEWKNFSAKDFHSLSNIDASTIFADTSNYNFHLKNGSPAIDAASSTAAPNTDYEGNSRPFGAGFDIGAYEKNLVSNINDNNYFSSEIEFFPNPAKDYTLIRFPEKGNYILNVIDLSGNTLLKKEISDVGISYLDVSIYQSGIYIIAIQSVAKSKMYFRKLIHE